METNITKLAQLPPPQIIDLDTVCCGTGSWIVVIGNFMMTAGVILAVIVIVYSGIKWMTAGGNEEDVGKAKKLIAQAVIGLAIVMAAYAITAFVFEGLKTSLTGTPP